VLVLDCAEEDVPSVKELFERNGICPMFLTVNTHTKMLFVLIKLAGVGSGIAAGDGISLHHTALSLPNPALATVCD